MSRSNSRSPNRLLRITILAFLFCNGFSLFGETVSPDFQEEVAFKQAVAVAAPSVVKIDSVGGLDNVGGILVGSSSTTGVVMGEDGWILSSSFNFAGHPTEIIVTLPDGQKVSAKVVARDYSCHLTLLKVEASGLRVPQISEPTERRIGQWTIGVGRSSPNGDTGLTVGILSAMGRIYGRALQTDAKVSPVNYGGPLIDLRGHVLGILVPLSPDGSDSHVGVEWYDSGIGFAIPMERILRVFPRLKGGEDLYPGLAGFGIRNPEVDGTVVDRVRVGSPAFTSGIRANDEILEVDGVRVRRDAQIRQVLGGKYADESVKFHFQRNGKRDVVELKLVRELKPYEIPLIGILPEESTNPSGILIRDLIPGSPAASSRLLPGDVLIEIDGTSISRKNDLRRELYAKVPESQIEVAYRRGETSGKERLTLSSASLFLPAKGHQLRKPETPPKISMRTFKEEGPLMDHRLLEPADLESKRVQVLVVCIHPPGKPEDFLIHQGWRTYCDSHGIVLLAPTFHEDSTWNSEDLPTLIELIDSYRLRYGLPRERVAIYGGPEAGAFALTAAMKSLSMIGGMILWDGDYDLTLPDLEPEQSLSICLLRTPLPSGPDSEFTESIRRQKYPLYILDQTAADHPPDGETLRKIVDWVVTYDRL